MHHVGAVGLIIFAHIFQAKTLRQVEIELDRAQLPLASEGVMHLQVDLRAIEGSATLITLVGQIVGLHRPFKGFSCPIPVSNRTNKLLGPSREVGCKVTQPKGAQHVE